MSLDIGMSKQFLYLCYLFFLVVLEFNKGYVQLLQFLLVDVVQGFLFVGVFLYGARFLWDVNVVEYLQVVLLIVQLFQNLGMVVVVFEF